MAECGSRKRGGGDCAAPAMRGQQRADFHEAHARLLPQRLPVARGTYNLEDDDLRSTELLNNDRIIVSDEFERFLKQIDKQIESLSGDPRDVENPTKVETYYLERQLIVFHPEHSDDKVDTPPEVQARIKKITRELAEAKKSGDDLDFRRAEAQDQLTAIGSAAEGTTNAELAEELRDQIGAMHERVALLHDVERSLSLRLSYFEMQQDNHGSHNQ